MSTKGTGPPVQRARGQAITLVEKHNESEQYWVKLQKWLEENGYMLRPRFKADWVPSWPQTEDDFLKYEDGHIHFVCISSVL